MKRRVEPTQIIGDGPISLGPYRYESRFELKTKLEAFLTKSALGVITHTVAIEKLMLIWQQSGRTEVVLEFRILTGVFGRKIETQLASGSVVEFHYEHAVDNLS